MAYPTAPPAPSWIESGARITRGLADNRDDRGAELSLALPG